MSNKKTKTEIKAQQIVEMLQAANISYTDMLEVIRLARLKLNQRMLVDTPEIRKQRDINSFGCVEINFTDVICQQDKFYK